MSPTVQWRRAVEPGLLAAGSASAFAIVYYATVRTEPGRLLGDASLRGALLVNSEFATFVDSLLGLISLAALLGGIAGIAMIALLRENRVLGVVAVSLVVGANVSTWLLKNILLSRPDLGLSEVTPATHNSLPSGHVTAVFSVFVALLIVLPPWWRDAAGAVGAVVGAITALAAMTAGWHRAGDSLAAFLLVGFWAGLAGTLLVLMDDRSAGLPTRHATPWFARARRWMAGLAGGVLFIGAIVALSLVVAAPVRASVAGPPSAFVAGALLIIGFAVIVMLVSTIVLDRIGPRVPPLEEAAPSSG